MKSKVRSGMNAMKNVSRRCGLLVTLLAFMPSWAEAQDTAQVGYARLRFDGSSVVPTGSAVFSYRNPEGVLVSEAGVAAVEVLERGRIFVDQAGTRTGLALVNPETQSSAISFTLRDAAGTIVDSANRVLEPGNHLARFVDELFIGMPAGFQGSVTFESLAGLGAITLRESQNSNQEPLYTTLPVADLDEMAGSGSLTFPHLAAGGGYLTQVLLINGTSAPAEGRIRFIGSDGLPLSLVLDGLATSEVRYELAPDGVFSAELEGGAQVEVGYAVLTPDVGSTPSGSVLFEFTTDGQLISAAGVGATDPTTAAKIAIDNVGRQTGFALANPGLVEAEVEIRLQDRFGVTQQETSLTIAADGHIARLANEFFPTLSTGFNGLIEIESTVPIVPITLQLTINSRGDLVLTTLPVADLAAPAISVETVFPQFVIGGGFSTRFVLIATAASGFNLTFHHTDGTPWLVPPTNESTIGFQLGAGQSVRTFPGNTAEIASISIRDPITNLETTELTLNQGSTLRPRVLITDTEGNARDDLLVNYTSFNPSVATVDAEGLIAGIGSGFSTLTVDGNGILATATISVVEFAQSTGGFATDVVQSGTGTLFVTSTGEHTILSLDNLQTTLYAGSHLQRGFLNDERLLSRFDGPSYLAIDRASGRLYVSDTENHAIRMVPPGATQSVTTLAGGGTPGFVDASSDAARFDTPKGVAIDSAGFLWVVDQANHVIRRINLGSGQVETVAGTPGVSGSQDGNGSAAGFNTPTGIAIEPESLAAQLLREAQGGTAPPIQVVVTDTGNGLIRRITENGDVSTVSSGAVAALSRGPDGRYRVGNGGVPLRFDSPTGIAVGPLGNIYVIESESGQIRSILPTGEVVTLAARGSFEGPNGLVVGDNGEIIVASTDTPLTEIRTAAPVITAINPASVSPEGGETVVVHGANFEPDAVLAVAQVPIAFTFHDTSFITFVTPVLPDGQASLSLTTRGGVAVATFTVVDTSPPTVAITVPSPGEVVSGQSVLIRAVANDNEGVESVGFFVDDVSVGTDTSAPYEVTWDTTTGDFPNGSYGLKAIATDLAGNETTSAVVTVSVSNADTSPPTVAITVPSPGEVVSGQSVLIRAVANDNEGVESVGFFVDDVSVGTDTSAPYEVTWDTTTGDFPNGSYGLKAIATDLAGNETTSAVVTVSVSNADTSPPTVAITVPSPGEVVSGQSVLIRAVANDNEGVESVGFFVDDVSVGTDTSAPYEVTWDTTTGDFPNGSYDLTAIATDLAGNETTSAVVTVSVSNADTSPPTVAITVPSPGEVVSGNFKILAVAADHVGVASVKFFVDGVLVGTDTSAPHAHEGRTGLENGSVWDTTTGQNGSYDLTAVATDLAGNETTSAVVTVSVSN